MMQYNIFLSKLIIKINLKLVQIGCKQVQIKKTCSNVTKTSLNRLKVIFKLFKTNLINLKHVWHYQKRVWTSPNMFTLIRTSLNLSKLVSNGPNKFKLLSTNLKQYKTSYNWSEIDLTLLQKNVWTSPNMFLLI